MGLLKGGTCSQPSARRSPNSLICPFCGQVSRTRDHCSVCGVLFDAEIRRIARRASDDPNLEKIGPFSVKAAKIISYAVCAVLVVLFVALTQYAASLGM